MPLGGGVGAYLELAKPASVALLAFTALAGFLVASGGKLLLRPFWLLAASVILASAGANATTCYLDRDIDSLMRRTRRRPLPAGRIRPPERGLYYGLGLMGLGLALALAINRLTFFLMLLGLLDNVVVYSLLAKRRSRWNVLLGGASGGIPTLLGWSAATGGLSPAAFLMALLVVLWIPNHIWNLAIYYDEDYRRARIPMLPVVSDLGVALRYIAATVLLMYAVSLALLFVGGFGGVYLGIAAPAGLALALGNLHLLWRPSRRRAWLMFKLSSPYLLLVFLAMVLDVYLI